MTVSDVLLAVGMAAMPPSPVTVAARALTGEGAASWLPITHRAFYVSAAGMALASMSQGLTWWAPPGLVLAAVIVTSTFWCRRFQPVLDEAMAFLVSLDEARQPPI